MNLEIAAWAVASAVIAVSMEAYLRHTHEWTPWLLLPAMLMNFALAKVLISASSLFGALALFNVVTISLRVVVSIWLGELDSWHSWVRAALYGVAAIWR